MGIKLQEAGIKFCILEKQPDLGGAWHSNQYPGARCDVTSSLYQYSFFMNPNWSEGKASAKEIKGYLENAARQFNIYNSIKFNVCVRSVVWNEDAGEWLIKVEGSNEVLSATHVVSACGALRQPNIPKVQLVTDMGDLPTSCLLHILQIEGADRFTGKSFHSSRWDHTFNYKNKKVAVIGTSSTAVQIVPEIIDDVKSLHVFQVGHFCS